MKPIAIIADIHGNKSALEAVLKDIYNKQIETIYCLGDISAPFGGDEIWRILKDKQIPVIMGNGDQRLLTSINNSIQFLPTRNSIKRLGREILNGIKNLPYTIVLEDKKLILCHGTPENNNDFLIYENMDLNTIIDKYHDYNIIGGHSHDFRLQTSNGNKICTIGSVGIAFNLKPQAEYAIVSNERDSLTIDRKIVPYNNLPMIDEMLEQGFIEENGPIGLLAFDEIICHEDRIYPFLSDFCKNKHINDGNIFYECREYLEHLGRWDSLRQYIKTDKYDRQKVCNGV